MRKYANVLIRVKQTDSKTEPEKEERGGCGSALQVDVVYALFHGLMDGDAICD